jgi:hypothetical protein
MFIVWGRKIKRRAAGYVADYCPICRAKRIFELQEVRSASHVYYISLSRGQLVGHERRCAECGTSFKATTAAYAGVSKVRASLDELERHTYPGLDAAIKDQVSLDERIRRQRLTPGERQSLIRAPFIFLSPKVERRFAATHVDAGVGLALAAAVALLVLAEPVGKLLLPDAPEILVLVVLATGIGLVAWQVVASGSRFMKREVVPVLATALKPLQPTQEEIELVLGELRKVKQKIGRKLRAADLLESLQTSPI